MDDAEDDGDDQGDHKDQEQDPGDGRGDDEEDERPGGDPVQEERADPQLGAAAAWLRELQDELGLKRGVHILRHTFATQALKNGASLREVQALLGNTNIATTERYLLAIRLRGLRKPFAVDPEDKIADCHPGNNLGAGALGICPG